MAFLDDMALFVEVVKHKGFRGAAEALNLPSSTVSRRISALEKHIGLRLLNRSTRKIELTEAGGIYYERCRHIVKEATAAHLALSDMVTQAAGRLRLSLALDVAKFLVAPFLAEFAERYPAIDLDFDLSDRHIDLIDAPIDLAIRVGAVSDLSAIAYPLAQFECRLYASPLYLQRFGAPDCPEDLRQHQCLARTPAQKTWLLRSQDQQMEVPIQCRWRANDLSFSRHLASQGFGIIMLPSLLASEELARGSLQPVLPQWRGDILPVYALSETRLLPAKALRFIEFYREKLQP